MEENRIDFETEKNRRRTKIFYRLSKVLKKRTPDQCRSHHQKLQIKYHDNLDLIMEAVKQKIAEQAINYKEKDECSLKQTAEDSDDDQSTLVEIIVNFNELIAW